MPRTSLLSLATLLVLFACSGSACPPKYPEPPRILAAQPSLEQVMQAVNGPYSRLVNFSTNNATLSGNGFPNLRANIAFERPRKFRLRAEMILTGPEVDLGSNDDLFWFWVRRSQPAAVYFCRHDQFAVSNFRQIMPVEPEWLIEAMGVTGFDPNVHNEGPFRVSGGRLEIRSPRSSAAGQFTKITVVDEAKAVVLEQHLYDARGQRIATSLTSRHRFDPATGISMPQQVEIQWPANQVTLHIELNDFQLNNPNNGQPQTYQKPEYPGYTNVDLAQPNSLIGTGPGLTPPPLGGVTLGPNPPIQPAVSPVLTPSSPPVISTATAPPTATLSPLK